MRTSLSNLDRGGSKYTQITVSGKERNAAALSKFFLDGTSARHLDLQGTSQANRDVRILEDGFVVKQTGSARDEFERTHRAEDVTNLTPAAGSAIFPEKGKGLISMEMVHGIPAQIINAAKINDADRHRIRDGIVYSLGKIHQGDGKRSLIHNDPHVGNVIIVPNQDPVNLPDDFRASVKFIDLEKANVVNRTKGSTEALVFDLLVCASSLFAYGFLKVGEVGQTLTQYLEGLGKLDRKDLVGVLKVKVPRHTKFTYGPIMLEELQQ